jgi:hypothetical protein
MFYATTAYNRSVYASPAELEGGVKGRGETESGRKQQQKRYGQNKDIKT